MKTDNKIPAFREWYLQKYGEEYKFGEDGEFMDDCILRHADNCILYVEDAACSIAEAQTDKRD